jgi:alkylation response protein AidB-like acyl-CoA dehydrogenase
MDFDLTDDQRAVVDLAGRIFTDRLTAERRRAVGGFDRDLWSELAAAGLLGISLTESSGGADQGFLATALLCEEVGRHAAPVPAAAVLVAALVLERGGADTAAVASGSAIVAPALLDAGAAGTVARQDGGGWRLDGSKTCVPAGAVADRFLVSTGDGLFVVDAADATVTPLRSTSGAPFARVDLADAPGTRLSGGGELVDWCALHLTAALCSQMAGAAKEAVALTASYTKEREQFERPIATFQAVGQRCADAYIDVEGIRLTLWQAAWRLEEGVPAATEVEVAKFWAADGGHRVVHAAVHLHGGMGVAVEYPIHRYFIAGKQIEFSLGGATEQRLRIGARLAAEPVA